MRTMKAGDYAFSLTLVLVVLMIIIPLPPWLIDLLLSANIALSVMVLLITTNAKRTLDFSTFPSLLLFTTIFRIGLNVGTTRAILLNGGDAGSLIRTFGTFVTGGGMLGMVVGVVMYILIFLVNFLVITKGAERVAEVAARFTLDAMPGKQMAIDADLNAGMIDEETARRRRTDVQRESDFFGAMDGASKFVKGDAIFGIIATLTNIVGGLIVGVMFFAMDMAAAAAIYVVATIGDGLAGQIPSLLISTSMGITVTKANAEDSLGQDLFRQMSNRPAIFMIVGGVIAVMAMIPGMNKPVMFMLALSMFALAMVIRRGMAKADEQEDVPQVQQQAEEIRKPENVVSLLSVDPIELEFGYGIIPLADASQGGDLLDRVVMIRRQCAIDLGLIVPVIRLRDNIQFASNQYMIKIKGSEVASGEIMLDHFLAMNPGDISEDIEGIETMEPAFGLPAKWINDRRRDRAELLGYTIVDPPSVIATHLTEIIRRHAHELLGRQQVQVLVDNLKQSQPSLVDEVVPKLFSLGEVQKVLSNLLKEDVSIRDMGTIIETMGDYGGVTRDPDMLTEYVRQALKRTITGKFVPDRKAHVITLDPNLENTILDNIRQTEQRSYVSLEADVI
ncbi:MAG: flagellar biosynthesis protein FlhA, partial [Oscillospiraceae bacterium]|nr:flagellar biosynthesis protein FlhA [Oscillospiraceae bacterium]